MAVASVLTANMSHENSLHLAGIADVVDAYSDMEVPQNTMQKLIAC